MENIFRKKQIEFLLCLKTYENSNLNQISKRIDLTYSHARKLLEMYSDYGMMAYVKRGRNLYIKLTEKGDKFTLNIIECLKTIEFKFIEETFKDACGFENSRLTLMYDPANEQDWFTLLKEQQVKVVKTEEL